MKVLIFSKEITPRLEYAARILLHHILEVDVNFTQNAELFAQAEEIKINYSQENFPNCLQIIPASILFENSIYTIDARFHRWGNLPVLFYNSQNIDFPYDPFAAAFWMVTRYEEYLPFEPDEHGRFRAEVSLAFKNGFLSEPIVHLWAESLKQAIKMHFQQFESSQNKFASLTTIDIDNAWAYMHKGFFRTTGAFVKDFLSGHFNRISERWNTLRGLMDDPFDSYNKFAEMHQQMDIHPQWFFLLGDYGKFDKNIAPKNPYFQNLIRRLALQGNIGMHPSYRSGASIKIMRTEKKRLEIIIKAAVFKSRQHFLKMSFPETYRRLINLGILEDYSMGYHDQPGFRAGMCIPFPWFDLKKNIQENLTIVPFQIMDRTFTEYLHLSPEKSYDIIRSIIDKTAGVQGQFVPIWHNEPADIAEPNSWFNVYEKMQKYLHG
jgi:hypothetical protein